VSDPARKKGKKKPPQGVTRKKEEQIIACEIRKERRNIPEVFREERQVLLNGLQRRGKRSIFDCVVKKKGWVQGPEYWKKGTLHAS